MEWFVIENSKNHQTHSVACNSLTTRVDFSVVFLDRKSNLSSTFCEKMKRNGIIFTQIPHFERENVKFEQATKSNVFWKSHKSLKTLMKTGRRTSIFCQNVLNCPPDIRLTFYFFDLGSLRVKLKTPRLNHYARHCIVPGSLIGTLFFSKLYFFLPYQDHICHRCQWSLIRFLSMRSFF